MIFKNRPADFNPPIEVVSCFCEHDGQILLLHRPPHKSQGDKWGAPAGKIDLGETPLEAIIREIREETGLIKQPTDLTHFNTVYVRYPDLDFTYHTFVTQFSERPVITINSTEHSEYTWVTPQQALTMPLILDFPECIQIYYQITELPSSANALRDL
jgi:8-oxo-dGTP diphosphatase